MQTGLVVDGLEGAAFLLEWTEHDTSDRAFFLNFRNAQCALPQSVTNRLDFGGISKTEKSYGK
ncbi:hypothetical protein OUZ56_002457 [Daphnia magna]|uniref:Uncharacterized protein n=1 Tax=Daphnia magna TaxID=35525 RepID=A0ABR0A681_9CRUS|nr:hypothetical protein OUZ56_002457 [Daphnia magna]